MHSKHIFKAYCLTLSALFLLGQFPCAPYAVATELNEPMMQQGSTQQQQYLYQEAPQTPTTVTNQGVSSPTFSSIGLTTAIPNLTNNYAQESLRETLRATINGSLAKLNDVINEGSINGLSARGPIFTIPNIIFASLISPPKTRPAFQPQPSPSGGRSHNSILGNSGGNLFDPSQHREINFGFGYQYNMNSNNGEPQGDNNNPDMGNLGNAVDTGNLGDILPVSNTDSTGKNLVREVATNEDLQSEETKTEDPEVGISGYEGEEEEDPPGPGTGGPGGSSGGPGRRRDRRFNLYIGKFSPHLALLAVAGQVFIGPTGGGQKKGDFCVGSAGTKLAGKENEILEEGTLLVDTAAEQVRIKTAAGDTTVSKGTTALLDANSQQGEVSILVLGGDKDSASICLKTLGINQEPKELTAGVGEKLTWQNRKTTETEPAPEYIPADGEHQVVNGRIYVRKLKEAEVPSLNSLGEMEMMVAGRPIRLHIDNIEQRARLSSHLGTQRKLENRISKNTLKVSNTDLTLTGLSTGQDKHRTKVIHVYRSSGAKVTFKESKENGLDCSYIQLAAGAIFTSMPESTEIRAIGARICAPKGTLLAVETKKAHSGSRLVRVKSCGIKDVCVRIGKDNIVLSPGKELLLADHLPNKNELFPHDGIGRRCCHVFVVGKNMTAAVCDFSLPSFIISASYLQDLKQPFTSHARSWLEQYLKTAVSVERATWGRGKYSS